ncbi:hypothetical protein Cgig2_022921 [Carnegiea gigantea]|uniref:Uncharacterized protein n=1 Tax=Carnegiea gigantea TaxID=171969 RepID=A0A9Q1K1Z5_9CARY|nr:hypothetical protein Cgig2_022921 [Carnegiea gigantea]
MDRHLVRSLVEGWNAETKAFKVGSREIPFNVYDVALLTGMPATEKQVTFDRGISASEVEEVIKATMEDHLARERNRRRSARLDVRLYSNYVTVMVGLCKQNNTPESLGHGRVQLVGGHLELPGGSNRGDKAEAVFEEELADGWLCDDTSGGVMCVQQVWFYKHTNLYAHADEICVPRITSWVNIYVGRNYDATVLISSVKDNQVNYIVSLFVMTDVLYLVRVVIVVFGYADGPLTGSSRCGGEPIVQAFCGSDEFQAYMDDTQLREGQGGPCTDCVRWISQGILSLEERLWQARVALRLEKETHAATKKKLEYMTTLLMARGEAAEVEKGLLLSPTREGSGDGPDTGGTPDECGDRSEVGYVAGEGPMGEHLASNVHDGQEGMEGSCSSMQQGGEGNTSIIVNRIWRRPCRCNPSVIQTSPYVNPEAAVGAGKCKGGIVRGYQKRSKKVCTHASEEPKAQ